MLTWEEKYNKLKTFINKNNRLPSQKSKDPHEKKLGKWCATQRQIKKGNTTQLLTDEQIKLLEQLSWTSSPEETQYHIQKWYWEKDYKSKWMENYYQLKAFVEKNHRRPSGRSKNPQEKTLGLWCRRQREAKKGKGKRLSPLTETQINLLEQIPYWTWKRDLQQEWRDIYNTLEDFIKRNNHIPKLSQSRRETFLKKWLMRQKNNINKLSLEQQKMLESINIKRPASDIAEPSAKRHKLN